MIISPGRRYIFVHIPKTGGTSLALALENKAMKEDILIGDTPKARKRRGRLARLTPRGRLWKHATLRDIDGVISAAELAQFTIFTLVRNPWDRMVSYYHWLRAQGFDHLAVHRAKALSFEAFLEDPQIAGSIRAAPYGDYVTDLDGIERCDLFLRLEDIAWDLVQLEQRLNMKIGAFPHENRSERDVNYRRYYTDETRDIVSALCATDIARFGYSF